MYEVEQFCKTCMMCQQVRLRKLPKALLQLMPVVIDPFGGVALDVMGPLPKSSDRYQFLLMIINYATQYPEAIPLHMVMGLKIAEELVKWVFQVGIPREIVTNQGSNFMSQVLKNVCQVLRIHHLRMIMYHPQTNGLVECFNRMLKNMLHCCAQDDPRRWDLLITPLLFAVREAPQSFLRYAPFNLVYGHHPHGLMNLVWEGREAKQEQGKDTSQYVRSLWQRLQLAGQIA